MSAHSRERWLALERRERVVSLASAAVALLFVAERVAIPLQGVWPTDGEIRAFKFAVFGGTAACALLGWAWRRGAPGGALTGAAVATLLWPALWPVWPVGPEVWFATGALVVAGAAAAGARVPREHEFLFCQAAMIAALQLGGCPQHHTPPNRPTIVLVTLDTARADAFDLCGETGTVRSPALTALAERSRLFCRAYAPVALTAP